MTSKAKNTHKAKAIFICLECGRKFYTARAAERAINWGCPRCGGSDIDIA